MESSERVGEGAFKAVGVAIILKGEGHDGGDFCACEGSTSALAAAGTGTATANVLARLALLTWLQQQKTTDELS